MECLADGVILDGMRVQLRELDLRSRAFVECEVRGVRCRASEAYFGGTVVEPLGVQASSPTGSVEGHPTAGISPTRAIWRLLTFRLTLDEIGSFERNHLQAGLFCTWIVGMGRWWDDPKAHLLQHLGLGSVIYSVVLAALVWIVVAPLRPVRWSYQRVLTFVTMTSPPAILYAIPVERFFDHSTAGQLNLWFLAAVASWRVA